MRREEIKLLEQPYNSEKDEIDRRFNSAIKADVPSAKKLVREIFDDFDYNSFGVIWWNSLPTEERILISDYLFQCVTGIEANLAEAQLHYFEWLDATERYNKKIANIVLRDSYGRLVDKMPKSNSAIDDLPSKLQHMHICGFFRAIGSTLDCLGATVIGVLALPCSLRKASIKSAQKSLTEITDLGTASSKLQLDFRDFFEKVKAVSGPKDWIEWADQYRNMYVHRGRRLLFTKTSPKRNLFYDSNELLIPRHESTIHLGKLPDRSDAEAFIKSEEIILNEDAEITLSGIFKSCRKLSENVCERLLSIWEDRRNNPSMLEQPQSQWDNKMKDCDFTGYDPHAKKIDTKLMHSHPNILKRMRSASVFGSQRKFWDKSKWK